MNMFNICKARIRHNVNTYRPTPHKDSLAKNISLLICLINSDKSLHRLGQGSATCGSLSSLCCGFLWQVRIFGMRFLNPSSDKNRYAQKPCPLGPMRFIILFVCCKNSNVGFDGCEKTQKIEPVPKNFNDRRKFRSRCVNVIDTT